jgi:mycoredoxin-dependent peroxiredoxin
VGVSADAPGTLVAFAKENNIHHPLLSDFPRRTMLTAYDAVITDPASPIFRYAKRAYFIVDRQGVLRYMKVQQNPLELLKPEEVLQALRDSGAK